MPAPEKLYVKEEEAARMLGHNVTWLRSNAETLESQYGFPKIDTAIGKRHKESIEEWARQRNLTPTQRVLERLNRNSRENTNAF